MQTHILHTTHHTPHTPHTHTPHTPHTTHHTHHTPHTTHTTHTTHHTVTLFPDTTVTPHSPWHGMRQRRQSRASPSFIAPTPAASCIKGQATPPGGGSFPLPVPIVVPQPSGRAHLTLAHRCPAPTHPASASASAPLTSVCSCAADWRVRPFEGRSPQIRSLQSLRSRGGDWSVLSKPGQALQSKANASTKQQANSNYRTRQRQVIA